MKLTIKNIVKKISNLPDEMKFKKLKERSSSPYFTEYHELAECYHKGIGTRRNYKEALKWYIKEAETGVAEAQYALGMRYWKGEKLVGGVQNEDEALRWMEIAADGGHHKAKKFIEDYEEKNPAKLEQKITSFVFGDIQDTLAFAKKIQNHTLYTPFIQNAIKYYANNKDGKAIVLLSDLLNDDHSCLDLLFDYADLENVQDKINVIEEKNRGNLEGQLMLADFYEKHCEYDKAFDILSISANNIKHSSTAEFIAFVQRLCTMYESMGNYDKVLDNINKASYKCIDLSKTTIPEEFTERIAHRMAAAGHYVKAMELFEELKHRNRKDVSKEISGIEEGYVAEITTEAKAYESIGDFKKASPIYHKVTRFKSGLKAYGEFLVRWAKYLEGQSNLPEAREILLAAKNTGHDITEDLQRIEHALKQKYGESYAMLIHIYDIEDFQELYALIALMKDPMLGDIYKTKAIELFEKYITIVENLEELEEYKDFAIDLGIGDVYKERITDFVKKQIDELVDIEEVTKMENLASKYGLSENLNIKKKEIYSDIINGCDDLDELEKVKEKVYELGLKEEYDKRADELGANIEEQIEEASNLEELAKIEELAYSRGEKDLFLEMLGEIIYFPDDLSFTHDYKLFSKDESKEVFLQNVENYIDADIEGCYVDDTSIAVDDIDESVWHDLSYEYCNKVIETEYYRAIANKDLEEALEVYDSYVVGEETELEYLYNNVADKYSFIELYEKYGNNKDVFLGQDVSEKYYEEGLELEDSGDIEMAVRYYKEAAKRGNAYAIIRIRELYEE